jgi:hypothetical protein
MECSMSRRNADKIISVEIPAAPGSFLEVPVWMPDRKVIFFFQGQTDLAEAENVLWENCVADDGIRESCKDDDAVYYAVVEALSQLILDRVRETARITDACTMEFAEGRKLQYTPPDRKARAQYRQTAAADRQMAASELFKACFEKDDAAWIMQEDGRYYQALNGLLTHFARAAYSIKNA